MFPEILHSIFQWLEDKHLRKCALVSRASYRQVDAVRRERARSLLVCILPGQQPASFCGTDILAGASGRVMKYSPVYKDTLFDTSQFLHGDGQVFVTVNGQTFRVKHVLDRFILCHGLALELSPTSDHTREHHIAVCAVYRPLSAPSILKLPPLCRVFESSRHTEIAMMIYCTTTKIDVLRNELLRLVKTALSGISTPLERNRIAILTKMNRRVEADRVEQEILMRLDKRVTQSLAILNLVARDLMTTPADQLDTVVEQAFSRQLGCM